jgi:hypothetical protein
LKLSVFLNKALSSVDSTGSGGFVTAEDDGLSVVDAIS